MFISTKLNKSNDFVYFLHICFHFHEVEFAKKYLMIYATSTKKKLFERETRNCK